MKHTLIILLVVLCPIVAAAQQHAVYADVGAPPGLSLTYNYQLTKNFCAGAGLQGYRFAPVRYDDTRFIPAVYADLRITAWATKKNRFITFLDLGMNMYKQDKSYQRDSTNVCNVPHNNGFCFGLGLGYARRMTKRGGGPYLSLKLLANGYNLKGYSIVDESRNPSYMAMQGNLALSVGFKF